MSELPEGVRPADEPDPRDSASGILLRLATDGGWRVLLGLRSRQSRFMPGHLAFPGGVMDPEDRTAGEGSWRRCASREIREETGLEIPAGAWREAGERVTPPMFPVRFRTRFFVAALPDAVDESRLAPASAENDSIGLCSPGEVLERWKRGETKLPPPVLPLLRSLAACGSRPIGEVASELERANAVEQRSPRIEFAPRVWVHPMRTATLPPATHTNVWMPGGRRFVVIDPGSSSADEVGRLLAVIDRRCAMGDRVLAVLLTHHHHDHVGGARAVATRLGCGIRAHPSVLAALPDVGGDPELAPLEEGDEIDLEGVTLRALHTPGHAPGHLAFLLVEPRLLVAGDLVSGMSTILIDPASGEMDAYLASLERVRRLDCRLLLPGHGPPLPGSHLRRWIEHRAARETAIRERLGTDAAALAGIAEAVYADVPQMPARLTEAQTRSHLIRLEKHGLARRVDPEGSSWRASGSRRASGSAETAVRIEAILRERFRPRHFELSDDSAAHAGHPGASSGGGHFRLVLVAAEFEGLSRVEQHRRVYEALAGLLPDEVHALGMVTRSPSDLGG